MAKKGTFRSKIPIPCAKLPISVKSFQSGHKNERRPLETIYQEPDNVATGAVSKTRAIATNNTEYDNVTVRNKSYAVDWEFSVFDDENNDEIEEGNSNIKKSGERHHSGELQGISPTARDDQHDVVAQDKRRSDFTEGAENPYDWFDVFNTSVEHQGYGPDLFEHLLKKEAVAREAVIIANSTRSLLLNWLIMVNGREGNAAPVQMAAWFLDTVLFTSPIPPHTLKLQATACFWVALKFDNHDKFKSAESLVEACANAFTAQQLIRVERAVSMSLIDKGRPVVAQDFISYFSWVCDPANFQEIDRAATLLYMAGLVHNGNLNHYYPSTLAVTAVQNALMLLDKTNLLVKIQTNYVYMLIAKKEPDWSKIGNLLWEAIDQITSPLCKYRALINFVQDEGLLQKLKDSCTFNAQIKKYK